MNGAYGCTGLDGIGAQAISIDKTFNYAKSKGKCVQIAVAYGIGPLDGNWRQIEWKTMKVPVMRLGRREWMQLAVRFVLGLASGLFASYYIYDTFLSWVPPVMVALWVGVELRRIRRAQHTQPKD